jgi:beta-carotene 3-hydroxylase
MSHAGAFVIVLATIAATRIVAWASHKYVMHGFGSTSHRDHHVMHDKLHQRNDLFALEGAATGTAMFSPRSPALMGMGRRAPGTWIGLGILVYRIICTLVHYGLVHQHHFRWVWHKGSADRLVHRLCHVTTSREGGVSFGFVIACEPALRRELAAQRSAGIVALRQALEVEGVLDA